MADSIRLDVQGIDKILRRFGNIGTTAPRIVAAAINSTASSVKAAAARDIMAKWDIAQKRTVLSTIKTNNASQSRLYATVEMSSKPLAYPKFKSFKKVTIKTKGKERSRTYKTKSGKTRVRKISKTITRYGVSVSLLKGGEPKIISSAFPATMKSGHKGAFQRSGTKRLPILEKKSITPTSMWQDFIDQHLRDAAPYLRARVIGQLEALIAKAGG